MYSINLIVQEKGFEPHILVSKTNAIPLRLLLDGEKNDIIFLKLLFGSEKTIYPSNIIFTLNYLFCGITYTLSIRPPCDRSYRNYRES
jgi:hypothetical protein